MTIALFMLGEMRAVGQCSLCGGSVAVGSSFTPTSTLHVDGHARLGLTGASDGELIFNRIAGTTFTLATPSGMATQKYYWPDAMPTSSTDQLICNAGGQMSWAAAGTVSNAWLTTGNSSTTAGTNYLGTSDNVDLVFKTNAQERMRVLVGGNVGIGTSTPAQLFHVEALAGSQGGQERIARFGVSDQANAFFQIWNKATASSHFAPSFYGITSTDTDEGLDFRACLLNTGLDAGDVPVMRFTSRFYNLGGTIENRPVFEFRNNSSSYVVIVPNSSNSGEGNVGIGTTTPKNRLDVEGSIAVGNSYSGSTTAPTNGAIIQGNVGIGTSSPTSVLTLAGDLTPSANNTYNLGTSTSNRWNTLYYSALVQGSDDRIKQNIHPLEYGLDYLLQLQPISYNLVPPIDSSGAVIETAIIGEQFGLSAQNLQEILPQLVHADGDSLNLLGVRYVELIPLLIKAIQEQNAQIQELNAQMSEQNARITNCCGESAQPQFMEDSEASNQPIELLLFKNDPNPLSSWTDIKYQVDNDLPLSLIIADVSGRIIKRLSLNGSEGTVRFYGSDLINGQYFYSLFAGDKLLRTEKMIVVK